MCEGKLLTTSLLVLVFSTPAAGQQSGAIIEGDLWVENGSAQGTKISLQNASAQIIGEVFADRDGFFAFRQIPGQRDYFLAVEKEGYSSVRQEVDLHVLGDHPHVNVFMRRADVAREKNPGGSQVSATELNLPKKAKKLRDMANEEISRGDNTSAIANLRRVLEIAPGFFPGENDLGVAFLHAGKLDDARESFQAAIGHNAAFAPAYVNLGLTFNLLHRYNEAERALDKALALEPKSWVANYQLAQAAVALRNDSKAVDCLEKALRLGRSQHPEMHVALANLYVKMGRYQPAAEQFSAYLQEAPKGPLVPRVKEVLSDMRARGAAR